MGRVLGEEWVDYPRVGILVFLLTLTMSSSLPTKNENG